MNVENAHGGEVENALTWQHEKYPDELYDEHTDIEYIMSLLTMPFLGKLRMSYWGKLRMPYMGKLKNTLSGIYSLRV